MREFVEFLSAQPPYHALDNADLERLARVVEVEYYPAGAAIVDAGGTPLEQVAVVRTGRVAIHDRGHLIDELEPGDSFGCLSVLGGGPPPFSAVADEDTLCYWIPDPRTVVQHPEALSFPKYQTSRSPGLLSDTRLRPVADLMRAPVFCDLDTTIRDAAQQMTRAHHSCVVYRTPAGVGIMTDADCRRRVATGEVSLDEPVATIGSAPAPSVDAATPVASAFLEMIHHGVHHLVVTDGGAPVGIARVFDLTSADVSHPLTLRAEITRATDLPGLARAAGLLLPATRELHSAGVPPLRIGGLLGAIIEAALAKCVALAAAQPRGASWFVLGSLARHEPLPRSDVDTAVVWPTDPTTPRRPERLTQAEEVLVALESLGLRRCPDGANAANPLFNRARDAWADAATRWRADPDADGALLFAAMAVDSRRITGPEPATSLARIIPATGGPTPPPPRRFLTLMLREALAQRPPVGFVRHFVVEHSGEHRGHLNLKRGGLAAVVAIARWTALVTGATATATQDRLRSACAEGLLTDDDAETLQVAHHELYELLFEAELAAMESGRDASTYLDPKEIDSLTRRHLRDTFRAIARVQQTLETAWVSTRG